MSNIIHQSNNNVNSGGPKLVFMGTPEFAVPILEKLINSGYKPTAVFCAPDKPVGRKQILTPPPVKILAQKYNLPIYQPEDKNELSQMLLAIDPQLVITAAYGLIFPKEVLDAPQYGCLNIHPSLLPKYRGPSPIQAAILNGDMATGVTIYKMDEKIDHGSILAKSEWPITNSKITTPELSQVLSELGAQLLVKTLPDWLAGKITLAPQNDSLASHTKIIKKEDGQIDWQKSVKEIEQKIRAYTPWPGSFGKWPIADGQWQSLKILEAATIEKKYDKKIGEIFLIDAGLAVQTGSGALIIKNLQLEGGKPLNTSDFLRGHKEIIGTILN